MINRETSRFLYRSHAVGLAATFQKPYVENIGSLASTALAITGGVATARHENFKYRDILSFASAETQLVGNTGTEPGVNSTLTTTTVDFLNVMNVLTADRIVLRMSSRHFMDGSESTFTFLGSHIDNLRLGGFPLDVQYNTEVLAGMETFAKAKEGFCRLHPESKLLGDLLPLSIVASVTAPPGMVAEANRIDFPEFGSVYLGEVFIKDNERRLTMMRLALGCAVRGDVTIADGDGNGAPINP